MKAKNIFTLIFAAAALCACSSGDDGAQTPPATPPTTEPADPTDPQAKLPINISTSLVQLSGTRVTDYAFEAGDKIGLYVVNRTAEGAAQPLKPTGNHVDNMAFTYSGTWTPATPIYWLDDKTHADFYLYYPYRADMANVESMAVSLKADQSTEEAYKASDFLVGSATDVAPTEQAVSIASRHLMSQMLITLVPGNGFTDETLAAANMSVRINAAMTNATVSLASATVSPTGATSAITPLKTGEFSYKALIVPQEINAGNLITVTVDGRDFNLPRTITLESGHLYRCTVTLSKTSNGINVSIDRWQDDGVDYGGTAE